MSQKKGPTRHRPMAHPVMFRSLSNSTMFAENGPVHRLRREVLTNERPGTEHVISGQMRGHKKNYKKLKTDGHRDY